LNNGDDSQVEPLLIDGCRLLITKNLSAALFRLRSQLGISKPGRLWIDAVCIDQANISERNAQVAMMATIYATAYHVIVWLGDEWDHDADLAREMISEAQRHKSPYELGDKIMYLEDGFDSLIGCRYFQRRWIVQELRHAQQATIRWAGYGCSQEEFLNTIYFLSRGAGSYRKQLDLLLRGPSDYPSQRTSLVESLAACEDMECRYPIDRVYSLLSMYPDSGIKVDYGESCLTRTLSLACHKDWRVLLLNRCAKAFLCLRHPLTLLLFCL
jgi:hypothetical protein